MLPTESRAGPRASTTIIDLVHEYARVLVDAQVRAVMAQGDILAEQMTVVGIRGDIQGVTTSLNGIIRDLREAASSIVRISQSPEAGPRRLALVKTDGGPSLQEIIDRLCHESDRLRDIATRGEYKGDGDCGCNETDAGGN